MSTIPCAALQFIKLLNPPIIIESSQKHINIYELLSEIIRTNYSIIYIIG